eukprot:7380168-Prymnesium_polylepis.1
MEENLPWLSPRQPTPRDACGCARLGCLHARGQLAHARSRDRGTLDAVSRRRECRSSIQLLWLRASSRSRDRLHTGYKRLVYRICDGTE